MDKHSFILILIMAIITMTLRFLPFVIFKGRKTPDFISYLGFGTVFYMVLVQIIFV